MSDMSTCSQIASRGTSVSAGQVADLIAQACPVKAYNNKKVLVIGHDASARAAVSLAKAKGARVSVVPAGPEAVSDRDIEALENLGGRFSVYSNYPVDPRLN